VELVQSLMELHGTGIGRMMEIVAESGESGLDVIDGFGRDELVGGLLLLYGLHPIPLETRVRQALDKVRPYLQSHGATWIWSAWRKASSGFGCREAVPAVLRQP
jgi:hypothetical protein